MAIANCLDNEVNVNEVGGGKASSSRTKWAFSCTTSHINGGNDEVEGKVVGGGDIRCRTATALAWPRLHTNEDNNEVEGKVMGGLDGRS
jgi:hypothetical protein